MKTDETPRRAPAAQLIVGAWSAANASCITIKPIGIAYAAAELRTPSRSDDRYTSQHATTTTDSSATSRYEWVYRCSPTEGPPGHVGLSPVTQSANQCDTYVAPTTIASAAPKNGNEQTA